jgi:hypothetical protein
MLMLPPRGARTDRVEERALDRCELVFRENLDAGGGILAAAFLAGFLTGFLAGFLAGMCFLMAMSGGLNANGTPGVI